MAFGTGRRGPSSKEASFTAQHLHDTQPARERAFLIAVDSRTSDSPWDVADSLVELAALAKTAGAQVVGSATQRLEHPDPTTYLGKGRIAAVADECKRLAASLIIADDELAPGQQRALEDLMEFDVIDRTALILDIFAQHARTREGQLQVELAQYEYRLPRLIGRRRNLSRLGGGSRGATGGVGGAIGARGPGETKLEIDRRLVRARIAELRHAIEEVREQRSRQRSQRLAQALPVVAVVGYTNAGKSTLFNALTSASVLVEDQLFATLDPTTRHLVLPSHQEILLTDTVGFIQKLPTQLIAAFRATLEEVSEADVLLEVVDITHDNAVEQSETVNQVLGELNAENKPRVTALNKIDRLADPSEVDLTLFPNAVAISALTGAGFDRLLEMIGRVVAATMDLVRVVIPFDRSDLVEQFHRRGRVRREEFIETGTLIHGFLPTALRGLYQPFELRPSGA
jgi:GTP-binding protein HflX